MEEAASRVMSRLIEEACGHLTSAQAARAAEAIVRLWEALFSAPIDEMELDVALDSEGRVVEVAISRRGVDKVMEHARWAQARRVELERG